MPDQLAPNRYAERKAAQTEYWDVTERLFYCRAKVDQAAAMLRLLSPGGLGAVAAAALARLASARVEQDAAFEAYKRFRDAHAGETFVAARPDIAERAGRKQKRRAAITRKQEKPAC